MRLGWPIVALALLLTVAACHTSKPTPAPTPAQMAEGEADGWKYMVANFRASAEGVQANGQVRVARDSVLWMVAYKMIELGRVKATHDSIWVSIALTGQRLAGTYGDLEAMIGARWDFNTLQEALLADEANERIAALLTEVGIAAKVYMGERRYVEHTDFPIKEQ